LGGDLGVDAVQEFSVITSNVSAEYGRTSGGVINAITKSGTNQFHGGVYEFLRTMPWTPRTSLRMRAASRKVPSGKISSGPPRAVRSGRTKLFIFGDYEGIRYSKGLAHVDLCTVK